MSTLPTLVLTRPRPAALRVLQQVEQAMGQPIRSVIAPVLQIVDAGDWPDIPEKTDVVLTSEHAVRGDLTGVRVHCVGVRTAQVAAARGAKVITTCLDAEELIRTLKQHPIDKAFLHICGSHKAVDVAAHLSTMGYACDAHQVYAQIAHPLSEQARTVLEGEGPAMLPLFSPRSARLVGKAVVTPGRQLTVLGMSGVIAEKWQSVTGTPCKVVPQPTGQAMISGIVAALGGHVA